MAKPPALVTPYQMSLQLTVEREIEVDGIGMGVLSDGTAYLTGRGLARMCGIEQRVVFEMTNGWLNGQPGSRDQRIKESLKQQGYVSTLPYIEITVQGVKHYAYPDIVCMAILEYYAFEARPKREQALKNYRLLARKSFREFIYTQTGYNPNSVIPLAWKQFHDRVSLVYDSVPAGYFSVFKEIADIVVTLIREGAQVGPHFVPDISVGQAWATHWKNNGFSQLFGDRRQFEHNYPSDFPQAPSNPQPAYCYPDSALGEFRRWMRESYLSEKFPAYLTSKQKQGALPASFAELATRAIAKKISN